MDISDLKNAGLTTPAWVLDETEILNSLQALTRLRQQSGCKILYSIKSLPLSWVLAMAKPYIDGFSVSSLFEARLAREVLGDNGSLHLTTPGIKAEELPELATTCSHINFNSLSQFQRLAGAVSAPGLRINPKLSFVADDRYNPCRAYSKLGASIDEVWQAPGLDRLCGLHLHTNFGAAGYAPLLQTAEKIETYFQDKLTNLSWLNLGGGYLFNEIEDSRPFVSLVKRLTEHFGLSVYIEPGKAVVGKAGYLLASVIDIFCSDGKTVAVLDTSVNHHPEVFEYQLRPALHEYYPDGVYSAQLVGCTCLAGDIFGDYRFADPLQLGDTVVFKDVGAYSLIKANRFNGHNLPDVYRYRNGQLQPIKQYDYQDFRRQWWTD